MELDQAAAAVGDNTPATLAAVEVSPQAQSPWTGIQDLFIKTSSQLPGDSLLLVGECLFLQLLPHLLPNPFVFIQHNRRFGAGACPQVSILQGTVPTCTRKKQEIINSYYLEEI